MEPLIKLVLFMSVMFIKNDSCNKCAPSIVSVINLWPSYCIYKFEVKKNLKSFVVVVAVPGRCYNENNKDINNTSRSRNE